MLEALYEAERALPDLLRIMEGWTGLYADTEKPALTRVWRQWGENRLYLHMFGQCPRDQVFPHPHPWQSAVRVFSDYEMGIGTSEDGSAPPPFFERSALGFGSLYEILNPRTWHWVRPTGDGSYSVMVAGPPIYPQNRVRANTPARGLTLTEIRDQLDLFKRFYPRSC